MSALKLKRSFTASFNLLRGPRTNSSAYKLQVLDRGPGMNDPDSGWLLFEDESVRYMTDVTLRFDLLDELTQAFRITCESPASFAGDRLDISGKGYLGFYGGIRDQVYWHLKVVSGQPGEGMLIHICDKNDNFVSYFEGWYLGIGGSRPALGFEAVDYREL